MSTLYSVDIMTKTNKTKTGIVESRFYIMFFLNVQSQSGNDFQTQYLQSTDKTEPVFFAHKPKLYYGL